MRSSGRTATLQDVADVAGVSLSTASRVLNGGSKSVSQPLATRVLAVAESVGYVSNQAARALRGRRTAVVLLASDPRTASIAAMAAGMEEAGRESGVIVSITAVGTDADDYLEALRTLRGLRPRALVVTSASFLMSATEMILPELQQFQDEGGNVVFIGEHGSDFPTVRFDDVANGRMMGRYMASLGRRRPAILAAKHPALESRTRGFIEGLAEHGIDESSVVVEYCDVSRQGGRTGALRLADRRPSPDLVLAGNDVLAIGALSGFRQMGVNVPGDVAVSGIDDIPLARDVTPALTTVALSFVEAGHAALRMALTNTPSPDVQLSGELMIRASTSTALESDSLRLVSDR